MTEQNYIELLKQRGYLHQCTDLDELSELMSQQVVPAYIGFDCTAKSLHVGSLVQIMMLRWLQKCGHKPIVLMGGGTTKVGDPSGKDEARKFLSTDAIEENKKSIAQVFAKFIKFGDGPTDAIMVDNAEWLEEIKYIEFLRDYGKHFTINRMLTFDSVKLRLDREQPLTFLEFNYMLLQAYDFAELNKRYDCRLQMGGSDQWGNIVNGTDLGRRVGCPSLFGLTSNLITTSSGAKMGKTASGAIWLNEDMLSAYDYWQFWRNTEDDDVIRFLKMFTELSLEEIEELAKLEGKAINDAKVVLANAATAMIHGEEAAKKAEQTAKETFELGASGSDLPVFEISKSDLQEGIPAFKLFALSGLSESGGAAKRLLKGKGGRINNVVIASESQVISSADLNAEGELKISSGQKKHLIVRGK